MPDYSKSKIYKLQCEDGYFYIGSTISELHTRLQGHKNMSMKETSPVYNHINEIGWKCVKIILIEKYQCNDRDELRKRENMLIQEYKSNPLCLNKYSAYQTDEERKLYCKNLGKEIYMKKRYAILEYQRKYRQENKDASREYQRKYREIHKERLKERDRQYRSHKKEMQNLS